MVRLKLASSGYSFSCKDEKGFREALRFFAVEKELTGTEFFLMATPPQMRLSWLPTGVEVNHDAGDDFQARRLWIELQPHFDSNQELASILNPNTPPHPFDRPMDFAF